MCARLVFGTGAASELRGWLPGPGESLLLVTGSHSYSASGAADLIEPLLQRHSVRRLRVLSRDPSIEEVAEAVKSIGTPPKLVVAVGGGSVIDTAKLVSLALRSGIDPHDLLGYDTRRLPAVDLVAIPTTAGSGAERTHFAVVYSGGHKFSVAADSIRPVVALVDPRFTQSLPRHVTASSGFDALGHALESMWSVHSTPESLKHSRDALKLVWNNLARAVAAPTSDIRRKLALGATTAGAAIDIARSTGPHALAYYLSSTFGLAHGHAVSVTLGAFVEFNAGVTEDDLEDKRGVAAVESALSTIYSVLEVSDAAAARSMIDELAHDIGLEPPEVISAPTVRAEWAGRVNSERMANNPRRVTRQALDGLLAGIP